MNSQRSKVEHKSKDLKNKDNNQKEINSMNSEKIQQ